MSSDAHGFRGLHHVQLAIPPAGEDASRAFWVDAMGMSEAPKPDALAVRGGCWFRGGELEVHVGVEQDFRPATKAHPALLVTDLSALAARLEARGIAVIWDDNFPGYSRFYVSDPFGNRIELLEPATTGPDR